MIAKGKLRLIRMVYVVGMVCMAATTVDIFMNWSTMRANLAGISCSIFFGTCAYLYLMDKYKKELSC